MDIGVKIGLLGGTFDPIHLGHMYLAKQAKNILGLEKVLFIPAGDPWMKNDKILSAPRHRLKMTHLALQNNRDFHVDDLEITRKGTSYTIDTIIELKDRFDPGTDFYLIMGEDAVNQINFWKDPNKIMTMVKLVVMRRFQEKSLALEIDKNIEFIWIKNSEMFREISSSKIRKKIKERKSVRKFVHRDVERYIRDKELYRNLDKKDD